MLRITLCVGGSEWATWLLAKCSSCPGVYSYSITKRTISRSQISQLIICPCLTFLIPFPFPPMLLPAMRPFYFLPGAARGPAKSGESRFSGAGASFGCSARRWASPPRNDSADSIREAGARFALRHRDRCSRDFGWIKQITHLLSTSDLHGKWKA